MSFPGNFFPGNSFPGNHHTTTSNSEAQTRTPRKKTAEKSTRFSGSIPDQRPAQWPICKLTHPPVLSLGDRGRDVVMLRRLLSDSSKIHPNKSRIIAGERFTPVIEQLVKQFQHQTFLDADGIVGVETWRTLCADSPVHLSTLERGDRGMEVQQLQERLFRLNFYLDAFDGWFSDHTLTAVKAFQRDRGLVTDGIVGPRTWDALSRPVAIRPIARCPIA